MQINIIMQKVKDMVEELTIKLTKDQREKVRVSSLISVNNEGYMVQFENIKATTNNKKQYKVSGNVIYVLKESEAQDEFVLIGQNYMKENNTISFVKEVNIITGNNEESGYTIACNYEAIIELQEEETKEKIKSLECKINGETINV